jgi:DNA-binding HxlR family transcriptional regulator
VRSIACSTAARPQRDALGFRALPQRRDSVSSSVLRQRLSELVEARLVEQDRDAAHVRTELGRDAHRALRPLIRWSDDGAAALAAGEAQP